MISFFWSTGSKILSIVSPTFYKSNGTPNWMVFYKINSSYLCVLFGLIIFKSFFCYFIFIQLLAWIWGSIINGHLLEFFKIIALSIEKSSFGNCYWFVHWPIYKGLDKIFWSEKLAFDLIFKLFKSYFHYETVSSL